jgi:hypothetical protein
MVWYEGCGGCSEDDDEIPSRCSSVEFAGEILLFRPSSWTIVVVVVEVVGRREVNMLLDWAAIKSKDVVVELSSLLVILFVVEGFGCMVC